jgi:hypothetical protein
MKSYKLDLLQPAISNHSFYETESPVGISHGASVFQLEREIVSPLAH